MDIINGNGSEAQNNVVCANAGIAISTYKGVSIQQGFELAQESLNSKRALKSIKSLQKISKKQLIFALVSMIKKMKFF